MNRIQKIILISLVVIGIIGLLVWMASDQMDMRSATSASDEALTESATPEDQIRALAGMAGANALGQIRISETDSGIFKVEISFRPEKGAEDLDSILTISKEIARNIFVFPKTADVDIVVIEPHLVMKNREGELELIKIAEFKARRDMRLDRNATSDEFASALKRSGGYWIHPKLMH